MNNIINPANVIILSGLIILLTWIKNKNLAFLHVDQSAAGWTRIWRSDLKAEYVCIY